MNYDFEIEKIIDKIESSKAKKVVLQLPDGLKPKSKELVEELEKKTKARIFIWAGTCYGACDLPLELEKLGIDLIIQFGHSPWEK